MGLIVAVFSPGTVGMRIIHACLRFRDLLGISELIVYKKTPDPEYVSVLKMMQKEGAKFAFDHNTVDHFESLGVAPSYYREEALAKIDVLIDCSKEGIPTKHKLDYEKLAPRCRVFVCQGAEEDRGFGKGPLVYGVNHKAFNFKKDRWIQIGSCNTHAGSFLIKSIVFPDGLDTIGDIRFSDVEFEFTRRSLDLNQKSKAALSTEITPHSSEEYGTHQAEDISRGFGLMDLDLRGRVVSSTMKIHEPYFHIVHFVFNFKRCIEKQEIDERLKVEPRILFSTRKLANYVFQFGTTYGFLGRFSEPVIVVDYDVFQLRYKWQIRGHGFVPQDGNFIFSNLAPIAGLNSKNENEFKEVMAELESHFLCPVRVI